MTNIHPDFDSLKVEMWSRSPRRIFCIDVYGPHCERSISHMPYGTLVDLIPVN